MNVLVFSKNALENGRGGEIFFIELVVGLEKYYKVTLLETDILINKKFLLKEEIERRLGGIKRIPQLKFAQLNVSNKKFNFPYPGTIRKIYKIIKGNDILYTTAGNFKINLIIMFSSLLNPRIKCVIGYHKPLHSEKKTSLYNLAYRINILFFSLFKKNFYHHTISLHTKKYLENFFNQEKISFLIEGLELDMFTEDDIEKKRDDSLKFVYLGFLDDIHKGVGVLLKAIEEFLNENKNLRAFFEIIGIGPLKPDVERLEKQFPKFVKYIGYLNKDELGKALKRNDILLFSSRKEPFGRVMIESLAAELIIICTPTVGSIEILRGKKFAFFLKNLSIEEFKERIMELYKEWVKNPGKIRDLQKLAKQYALDKYSISKEILMFKEFFNKITKIEE
ncbi:MAG: glycosyltransferase family 4 protein [Candidatus Lokiarchaeota archaeon]|nr:glycosyltransferase family 4 protein [Candidatus Lokiarchaeota archaeon]